MHGQRGPPLAYLQTKPDNPSGNPSEVCIHVRVGWPRLAVPRVHTPQGKGACRLGSGLEQVTRWVLPWLAACRDDDIHLNFFLFDLYTHTRTNLKSIRGQETHAQINTGRSFFLAVCCLEALILPCMHVAKQSCCPLDASCLPPRRTEQSSWKRGKSNLHACVCRAAPWFLPVGRSSAILLLFVSSTMGPERDRPKERAETDGGQTEAPPSEATYRRVGARSPSQATNIQILPNFFRSGNRQASSEAQESTSRPFDQTGTRQAAVVVQQVHLDDPATSWCACLSCRSGPFRLNSR
jgi:hypothetical protein